MMKLCVFQFREYYRATSKRPDASNRISSPASSKGDQYAQASNQVPTMSRYNKGVISNEINPPEVFSNRDGKMQNKLRRNKKQQSNRDNRTLILTGNVDLGGLNLKQNKQSRRKNGTRRASKQTSTKKTTTATTTTTTTQLPNTISETFQPNHHRHNHYDSRPQKKFQPSPTKSPVVTYRPETSTTRAYFIQSTTTTTTPRTTINNNNNTASSLSPKDLEKVMTEKS